MKVEKLVSNHLASNTFIVYGQKEAQVVDCGVEFGLIKEKLGDYKVAGILLTHGHYDHSINVLEYIKEFGAKAYANENAKKALADTELNYGKGFAVTNFENFEFLSGDGNIKIGEFDVKYYHCPGHSACLNSYLIDNELFVGDCMFADGIGRTDLITSDKEAMLDSLKKISTLDYETCHSGHYDDSTYEKMNKNINVYVKFLGRHR